MRNVERLYYLDLRAGIDGAGIPAALVRKYPTAIYTHVVRRSGLAAQSPAGKL
jgi:hypothetical protein